MRPALGPPRAACRRLRFIRRHRFGDRLALTIYLSRLSTARPDRISKNYSKCIKTITISTERIIK